MNKILTPSGWKPLNENESDDLEEARDFDSDETIRSLQSIRRKFKNSRVADERRDLKTRWDYLSKKRENKRRGKTVGQLKAYYNKLDEAKLKVFDAIPKLLFEEIS